MQGNNRKIIIHFNKAQLQKKKLSFVYEVCQSLNLSSGQVFQLFSADCIRMYIHQKVKFKELTLQLLTIFSTEAFDDSLFC